MSRTSSDNPENRGKWNETCEELEKRLQESWLPRESIVLLFHLWLSDRAYGQLGSQLDVFLQDLAEQDVLDRDVTYLEGAWKGRPVYQCRNIEALREELAIYDARCRLSDDPHGFEDEATKWEDIFESVKAR